MSDDDSADEIEDDFKLKNSNVRQCYYKYYVHINIYKTLKVAPNTQHYVTSLLGLGHLCVSVLSMYEVSVLASIS